MGSFAGHALPGTFFILFGIWLTARSSYKHFASLRKTNQQKKRCCRCNVVLFEGITKVFLSAIGFLMEQVTNNGPEFHIMNPNKPTEFQMGNNWSHCTMYTFFIFAGMADILVVYFPKGTPKGSSDFMMSLALFVEGYLFYFHTHGREELDVRLHMLLVLAIWTGAFAMLLLAAFHDEKLPQNDKKYNNKRYAAIEENGEVLETTSLDENDALESSRSKIFHDMDFKLLLQAINGKMEKNNNNLEKGFSTLIRFTAVASILLQGSWFWQVSFILYPPNGEPWAPDLHVNVMFATMFFTWHLATIIVFMSVVHFLVFQFMKRTQEI